MQDLLGISIYFIEPAINFIPQPKVVIVVTNSDAVDSYYKQHALVLANILTGSKKFLVSCNLWQMELIAQVGIAWWTHRAITENDKVVLVCSPGTKRGITQSLESKKEIRNPSSDITDVSIHMAKSMMSYPYGKGSKLVIVCMDQTDHDCLGNTAAPCLDICPKYKLPDELPGLITTLRSQQNDVHKLSPTMKSMHEELRRYLKTSRFQKSRSRNNTDNSNIQINTASYNIDYSSQNPSPNPEVQFDSLYSSRCNSHSTETMSSGEEMTFIEAEARRFAFKNSFVMQGARPKYM